MKDLLCFSLVLFVALVRSAVPDRGTRDLTSLAVDIETEKIKRLQLEVQVETLASQIITLQSRKHADDKQAVSFTAGVSQSIDTFSNNQIIVYDDVISNVGNGYNSQTGRFTAPVDGLYNFYFKTSVKGYHLLNMDLIVDDSAPVVSAYSAGQSATSGTGSASISMLLKKGSCVWVRARSPYASHLFVALQGSGNIGISTPAISFTAGVSQTIDHFKFDQTIIYDHVISNVGNAYDPNTGIFTAPVKGIYDFYFKTGVSGDNLLNLVLVVDGSAVVSAYGAGSTHGKSLSGSASVPLMLSKGAKVNIRTDENYASHMFGNSWNNFSGFLLKAL